MSTKVDEKILTEHEKSEVKRLRQLSSYAAAKQRPAYSAALGGVVLYAFPTGGLFWAASVSADSDYPAFAGFAWFLGFAVGALGIVSARASFKRIADSVTKAGVTEYLSSIRYYSRRDLRHGAPGVRAPTSDSSDQSKSQRQMQHEWYEGHSELNWRDRERAEMYGIDVETYISNVLDDDRD